MGCQNSRAKVAHENGNAPGEDAGDSAGCMESASVLAKQLSIARHSIMLVMRDGEKAMNALIPKEELFFVAASFLNTVVETCRSYYKLEDASIEKLLCNICKKEKLSMISVVGSEFQVGQGQFCDEITARLIRLFCAALHDDADWVPRDVFTTLHSSVVIETLPLKCSFKEIYSRLLTIANVLSPVSDVFRQYCGDDGEMSAEGLLHFLREAQGNQTVAIKTCEDRLRVRFGGHLHRYNFALFALSRTWNSALNASHSGTVWHDMAQPLPEYLIHTEFADSSAEVNDALDRSVRSIVLHCHFPNNQSEVYGGISPLREELEIVKKRAFENNSYPLLLCLAPAERLSIEVQEAVATVILDVLGADMLAKGIMFEGETLNYQLFNPSALQKRVLIVGIQAPLKPFLGFQVADMHRSGLGVRVTHVMSDTPADKAGICKDDWLTHINSYPIHDKLELKEVLTKVKLGNKITLRRENLDDVFITVGGVVDPEKGVSTKLSEIVFLRVSDDGPSESSNSSPWCLYTCKVLDFKGANRSEQLKHHFNFIALANTPEGTAGLACQNGVQFICADNSIEEQVWASSLFVDNGNCGYLHKCELTAAELYSVDMDLLTIPIRLAGCKVVRIKHSINGSGAVSVDEKKRRISIKDAGVFTVVALNISYERNNVVERTLTFGFLPSILVPGYRILPAYQTPQEIQERVINTLLVNISVSKTQRT